jgi:hypothetical protein
MISTSRRSTSRSSVDLAHGAAREISGAFAHTPARPVSGSTLSRMLKRRAIEGEGVLQMLRWLPRTPERLVPGGAAGETFPDIPCGMILRFDTKAIDAALDARRTRRAMTWVRIARKIGGVDPGSLTRRRDGGRTTFPQIMRIARWLGCCAASLTRVADR